MAELIDKGALVELFEEKMFNSELMCPIIKLADVLEILEEQLITTESEIRAKAIDEFAEKLKEASIRGSFEYKPDKENPFHKVRSFCNVVGTRKIDEIAEQLKGE